jgi:hypothetical protein
VPVCYAAAHGDSVELSAGSTTNAFNNSSYNGVAARLYVVGGVPERNCPGVRRHRPAMMVTPDLACLGRIGGAVDGTARKFKARFPGRVRRKPARESAEAGRRSPVTRKRAPVWPYRARRRPVEGRALYDASSHASSAWGGEHAGPNVTGSPGSPSAVSSVFASAGSVTTAMTLRRPPQGKALRWREDVDLIAKTMVNLQVRNKQTTTPKGRKRRTIPMTATLHDAVKRMSVIREGLVVRNLDGTAKSDDQADKAMGRICRRAGLPVRLFHTMRHTFGTECAARGCAGAGDQGADGPRADRHDHAVRDGHERPAGRRDPAGVWATAPSRAENSKSLEMVDSPGIPIRSDS